MIVVCVYVCVCSVMALQYDSTEEETGSLSRQLREMKQKHLV